MRLTWNLGYEDYSDTEHWLPRLAELRGVFDLTTESSAAQMTDEVLLNCMEDIAELMRYYCASSDMQQLEPLMRKFNSLLKMCRARMIRGTEILYLEMIFLRINAVLYRMHGQNRQGAEAYEQCLNVARKCLSELKTARHLSDEQVLFVGWDCVECWRETAHANDAILNTQLQYRLLKEVLPTLKWLVQFMDDFSGICDQASELFAYIGNACYQANDFESFSECFKISYQLLDGIDKRHGSDFYRARAIYMLGVYGFLEFVRSGNAQAILRSEQEADEYRRERPLAEKRDMAIVDGVKAMVVNQRSLILLQEGKREAALKLSKSVCEDMQRTLKLLKDDYKDRSGFYAMSMSNIAARIFNSYIVAINTAATISFEDSNHAYAEEMFKRLTEELNGNKSFNASGSSAAMLQANAFMYLGLIASERNDTYQADFYGTQAADLAIEAGQQFPNPTLWGVAVSSCSLVAEISLGMKNKAKAGIYADKGLQACERLAAINPEDPSLQLQSLLIKWKKKASRKFF